MLISLELAKSHVGAVIDDDDFLLIGCIEDASAAILDYLKARTSAIASVSVANPTVITTSIAHRLVSGETYTIAGTTTTPTVVGDQVVTVTGAMTFTVPVNVTSGQTSAAGTVGPPTWTEATLPLHVRRAILLLVTHLYEHRGDDMKADDMSAMAIERLLRRSRQPAIA